MVSVWKMDASGFSYIQSGSLALNFGAYRHIRLRKRSPSADGLVFPDLDIMRTPVAESDN